MYTKMFLFFVLVFAPVVSILASDNNMVVVRKEVNKSPIATIENGLDELVKEMTTERILLFRIIIGPATNTSTAVLSTMTDVSIATSTALASVVVASATNVPEVSSVTFVAVDPAEFTVIEPKLVVAKKINRITRENHLWIGGRLTGFKALNTLSQPIGFATESSDQNGVNAELSIQLKRNIFALEYLPLKTTRTLATKFYGSSLGEIKVITSKTIIAKIFPVDLPEWSVSVGVGAEYTELDGAIRMGGFKFPTKGGGWSAVFQLGGQYRFDKHFSLGLDYEKCNVRIITQIPGVPDLISTYTDRMSMRLMYQLF